jgi:sulfite reductase (NADPH) flavoprotein alpha-component
MKKSDSKEEFAVIDRLHPVSSIIKERYPLTKPGSTKHTYHISLDFNDEPLRFKVGDSIGIYPQNDPHLVQHLIEAMKAHGGERMQDPRSGTDMTLREFLSCKANLSRLTSSFLKLFYECEILHDKKNDLHRLLQQENKPLLSQYLSTHDPLDLFKEYSNVQAPLQELCGQFGPLLPRFYSIASSSLVFKNEVHLTVALFTFSHQGEQRYGVGSHFLCNLATVKETEVPIYVQPAHYFTLPSDDNAPIIMIGPGTGVAPYRAFMQERLAKGAKGKNWLFFGERNRKTDYFYEEDWTQWITQGKLRVDLAFSRDQSEKIYVQHRMYENAKEIWTWLEEGAYFYVCGDAHHMAKDVEVMLQKIAQEQGGMSVEAAKAYIKNLRSQKRYLADVY